MTSPDRQPPARAAASRLGAAGRQHGPYVAAFTVIAALFYGPAFRSPAGRIFFDGRDGAAFVWSMWAFPRAVFSGRNPFATTDMFHPVGAPLAFHTHVSVLGVVSWPLQKVFGLAVAVNVTQALAILLTGAATYALAVHVAGDRRAALVGAVAFTLLPFRFAHASGHFNLHHTEFLPLGVLTLLLLYERPSRRRALVAGAVAGLAFLNDFHYALFLGLAMLVVVLWRHRDTRLMLRPLLLAALAFVVVALPLLAAMVAQFGDLDPTASLGGAELYSSDLLSWVVPWSSHPLWGGALAGLNAHVTGGERLAFPGFALLLLAGAGVVVARGKRGLWVALFGVFFALSLGPFLRVNGSVGSRFEFYGQRGTFPLPYLVLRAIPGVNAVRVPGRFSVMAALALCVLAALALVRLFATRPRWAWPVTGAVLAVMALEYLPGPMLITQPARVPPAYRAVAAAPGALLELPLQWRSGLTTVGDEMGDHTIYLYWATSHGRPVSAGMVARYPEDRLRQLARIRVYREILDLQDGTPTDTGFGVRHLQEAGFGTVAYHRDRPAPAVLEHLEKLGLEVAADDGVVIVFRVPGPAA